MPVLHQISPAAQAAPAIQSVALIGPPNSGKSTLFNRLTRLRQKVGNYPGITIEHHSGTLVMGGREVSLIDLPGVYSLTPYSEDERVAVDVLSGKMAGVPRPDAVLLVLDATSLTRQLTLAAPVIAMGLPTLVLLNMADLFARRGGEIDTLKLARELGAPVALVSAVEGTGMEAVERFLQQKPGTHPPVQLPVLSGAAERRQWAAHMQKQAGFRPPLPASWTRRLDAMVLHKVWGPLIFLGAVAAVFQSVFGLGQPLSTAFGDVLNTLGQQASPLISNSFIHSLLLDGIWKGVSSVLVFLPQILLLFLFIGLLEDSGYLARAALISDRTMRSVGLNGKAFIPLLSAYACAVPAIMATRTIENKRDRFATILIAPFMTCSARLPIYTLLIAAFIPERPVVGVLLGTRACAMLGLYLLGFLVAIATAGVLKSSVLKSGAVPFVLELPEYRWPTWGSIGLRLVDRARVFLQQAGTVILCVSLLVWALTNLPLHNGQPPQLEQSAIGRVGQFIEPLIRPLGFNWKIGVGLLTSIVAREVIVGTLATLYGTAPETHSLPLQSALQQDLSFAGAMALLVFFAFAMQCTSTLAVVRRETNSWKWPAIQFLYMTALAYIGAFLVYHLLRMFPPVF
ncbi:MAG: ferrous iron transporter B [Acidobacteria bacterium]|nr:ferrous iron transporter B [Acidobacteriota bacterium]